MSKSAEVCENVAKKVTGGPALLLPPLNMFNCSAQLLVLIISKANDDETDLFLFLHFFSIEITASTVAKHRVLIVAQIVDDIFFFFV